MKNSVLLVLILVLTACQSINRTPKPDNLIEEGKMVNILVELSLVDAAKRLNSNKVDVKSIEVESFILEKFGVDSLQLVNSNAYYAENLKLYEPIFDSVQSRLERLKVELDTLKAIDKREKDSIKKAEKIKDSIAGKPKPSLKLFEAIKDTISQN